VWRPYTLPCKRSYCPTRPPPSLPQNRGYSCSSQAAQSYYKSLSPPCPPISHWAVIDRASQAETLRPILGERCFIPYPGQENYAAAGFLALRPTIEAFAPTHYIFLCNNSAAAGYDNILQALATLTGDFWGYTPTGSYLHFTTADVKDRQRHQGLIGDILRWHWDNIGQTPAKL
jgi:hypothetical protein